MSLEAGLVWLVKNLWLVLLAILGWLFKNQEAKVKAQDNKIQELEKAQRDFISHQEAKQMIAEIVDPLRQQHMELKTDLKHVLTTVQQIQRDLDVQRAVYQLQHEKDNK